MKLHFGKVATVSLLVVALGCGAAYGITWEAGLKAGISEAKLRGDPISISFSDADTQLGGTVGDYKLGFIGGGYAKANFSDLFGIQAEILYAQMGGQGVVSGYSVFHPANDLPKVAEFEGTMLLHLDYIELPVLAVFSFRANKEGHFWLRGFFGPTFSFNTSAEIQLTGDASMELPNYDTEWLAVDERRDAGEYIKDSEVGALIGFSLSYAFENVDLVFDTRWSRGFTTIDNTTNYRETFNSGVGIMAGITIPFGR